MADEPTASRDLWSRLRAGGHESSALEIPTLPAGVETPDGPVRMALGSEGQPRLLLPLRGAQPLPRMAVSEALDLRLSRFNQGARQLWFVDLTCLTDGLHAVFADVIDEMLTRIRAGRGVVDACRSTLNDFRALLVSAASRPVPDHVVLGLAGELLVLHDLMQADPDGWAAWRGPLGERHDFRAGRRALEVKATARVSDLRVRISSIDQLVAPQGGSLHLAHLVLEVSDGAPLTVGALAEAIEQRASQPLEFRRRLAKLDCPDPASPAWNRLSFSCEAKTMFRVEDGFPRVTANSFEGGIPPTGVVALEYDIDLGSAESHRLASEAFSTPLEEMLACLSLD